MRTKILTIAMLAALAAPAAAQTSTYDESAGKIAKGANSGVVKPKDANDVGAPATQDDKTGSISNKGGSAYDESAGNVAEGANSGVVEPGTSNDVGNTTK